MLYKVSNYTVIDLRLVCNLILNDGWKLFVTNRTDTETGVFLLVKKCMDDGLYAQISLYRGWIWVRLWRQSEGIIAVIIKYLFCLYCFLCWWLHWKSVLSLAILFLSQVIVKEAYESHNLMEDVQFVYL